MPNENNSYENKIRLLTKAINSNSPDWQYGIVNTFEDVIIIIDFMSEELFKISYTISDENVVDLGEPEKVNIHYITEKMNKSNTIKSDGKELSGCIFKSSPKQIVHGAVLIPDKPDSDGDVVTAERIEEVAHEFMESYKNIDYMHSLENVGVPVESYITKSDIEVSDDLFIPKGSWIIGVKVKDDEVWKQIEKGELNGFSMMGISKAVAATKSNEIINASLKRTTIEDLGDDWIVNAVSIVDNPAVEDATFISLKSKTSEAKPLNIKSKILNILNSNNVNKEENTDGKMSKEELEEIKTLVSGIKYEIMEYIDSKLEPEMGEELEKTDESEKDNTEESEDNVNESEKEFSEDTENNEESLESVKSELENLKSEISKKYGSNQIIGQDGEQENKTIEKSNRDIFGRRV